MDGIAIVRSEWKMSFQLIITKIQSESLSYTSSIR
jgi:hypothetical protein